jgi:hypothetical protein
MVQIGSNSVLSKRGRIAGAAIVALLVGIDFIVLRGDTVAHLSVPLDGNQAGEFVVTRAGEPHLISIRTTRHKTGSEQKGRSIFYRVTRSDDQVVAEEDEMVSRKTRYVRFTPDTAASYRIEIKDEQLLGTAFGNASVSVTVNDRRILPRLSPF